MSTGICGLDAITDGRFPRDRPTLVCGGARCGKMLLGMEFLIRGAVSFGDAGVFVALEEAPGPEAVDLWDREDASHSSRP